MAVKKVVQIICDRCDKPIDGAAEATPLTTPALHVDGTLAEGKRVHFSDLCPKCVSRIQALLGQIRLDEVAKNGDGKTDLDDNLPAAEITKPKPATKDATSASAKP